MNYQVNPKTQVGCLAIIVVLIPLVAFLTTASLNPLAVYTSDNLAAKIIVSVLALWVVSIALVLLQYKVVTSQVDMDVMCPGCGLPLLQYVSSHGMQIQCPQCKKWWHNGPACYNKGMPHKKILVPTYLCPDCRARSSNVFEEQEFNL